MKWPMNMPAAEATLYHDLRANRRTERSAMPMCIAMLQNQAKNITCQKVNLVWPGSGSPPFQMRVCAIVPGVAQRRHPELAQADDAEGEEDQDHPRRRDVGEPGDALVAIGGHHGDQPAHHQHRGGPGHASWDRGR